MGRLFHVFVIQKVFIVCCSISSFCISFSLQVYKINRNLKYSPLYLCRVPIGVAELKYYFTKKVSLLWYNLCYAKTLFYFIIFLSQIMHSWIFNGKTELVRMVAKQERHDLVILGEVVFSILLDWKNQNFWRVNLTKSWLEVKKNLHIML